MKNMNIKSHIPIKQLESNQKAVDIMEKDKFVAINVSKTYAIEFVSLYNNEIEKINNN